MKLYRVMAAALGLVLGGVFLAFAQGTLTSPLLNDFGIAFSPNEQNQSEDITTATTSDLVPCLDVSDTPDTINYCDGDNLLEIQGVTSTASELNILDGVTATAAELNYLDIATLGTGAASKGVVLDSSGDYTYPATGTIVYPSSSTLTLQSGSTFNAAGTFQIGGTAVTATAAELNLAADLSSFFEDVTATNILTSAECGKIMTLNSATEFASTLPAAVAGCRFKFIVKAAPSGAAYTILSDNGDNVIVIGVNELDVDTGNNGPYDTDADTVTFADGVSVEGDWVDCVSDGTKWYCTGQTNADGGITTSTT